MANVSYVNGFSPVETFDGVPYNGKVKPYIIGTGDSTAMFIGDLVNISGGLAVVTIASDLKGFALPIAVQSAATTTTACGVIVGFEPDRVNLNLMYRAASTQRVIYVCDAPMMLLEAQEDGAGTPIALADGTKNINIVVAAGNTVDGSSGMQLDSSTVATTATFPIRLIKPVPKVDNDNAGGLAYTKWRCMINNGVYKTGVLGV